MSWRKMKIFSLQIPLHFAFCEKERSLDLEQPSYFLKFEWRAGGTRTPDLLVRSFRVQNSISFLCCHLPTPPNSVSLRCGHHEVVLGQPRISLFSAYQCRTTNCFAGPSADSSHRRAGHFSSGKARAKLLMDSSGTPSLEFEDLAGKVSAQYRSGDLMRPWSCDVQAR